MRISYFKEFIVLSKYLNFSIAADLLNMTQPGLSRHISAIENELGIKLLERDTHNVKLTQNGISFLESAKRIIDEYENLLEKLVDAGSSQLRIGIPYFGIKRYISNLVGGFESAHPNVQLKYLPAYPETIVDALLSKQVDLGILPRINSPNSKRLVFHDAFREHLTVLMHCDHPLASKSSLQLADLRNENFLSIEGYYTGAMLEFQHDFCRRAGFEPRIVLTAKTIEEAVLNMKSAKGVLMMPGHLNEASISFHIKSVDLAEPQCYFTISLCHHPDNNNPLLEPFIDYYLKVTDKKSVSITI